MQTNAFITAIAGHSDDPGYQPTPDDELRALIEAFHQADALVARLSANTHSPTRVLLAAMTVEQAKHAVEIAQLKVATAAQMNLVHELPADTLTALRAVAADPVSFMSGETTLPADPRTVPSGRLQFKTPADCLAGLLDIDYFEALRRLRAANDLLPGLDQNGVPRGPRYPQLAEQLATGGARLGPTAAAARKLEKMRPGIEARPDAEVFTERAESRVADSLAAGDTKNTTALFQQITDELEDAEAAPTPAEIRNKTGISVTKRTRHFTYFSACMLNTDAEVFLSHFAESDNPRTLAGNRPALAAAATRPGQTPAAVDTEDEPFIDQRATNGASVATDAATSSSAVEATDDTATQRATDRGTGTTEDSLRQPPTDGPDWFDHPPRTDSPEDSFSSPSPAGAGDSGWEELTPAQRHLQTLLNLMRAPHSRVKGITGRPTSKLYVYITLERLIGLARGAGWSAHGLEISVSELRKRLAEFSFIPIVLGGDGELLDYGRERRYPPESMKQAIRARDRGCLGPHCTVPPEGCEFHHIKKWSEGGTTSVWNLGMFCTAEHRAVDMGDIKITMKNGVPWVLLPKYQDPDQIPRRNSHWRGEQPPLF